MYGGSAQATVHVGTAETLGSALEFGLVLQSAHKRNSELMSYVGHRP